MLLAVVAEAAAWLLCAGVLGRHLAERPCRPIPAGMPLLWLLQVWALLAGTLLAGAVCFHTMLFAGRHAANVSPPAHPGRHAAAVAAAGLGRARRHPTCGGSLYSYRCFLRAGTPPTFLRHPIPASIPLLRLLQGSALQASHAWSDPY